MYFDNSVNYWNVSAFNFKNNYFTSSDWVIMEICQEQQVSPVKSWLHAATTNNKKERVCWHKWKKHHDIKEHLILTDKPTILTEICSLTHSVTLLRPLTEPKSLKAICRGLPTEWRNLDFKRSHTFTAPTNLSGNWAMATDSVTFARAQTQLEERECLSPSLNRWHFKFQLYPRGRSQKAQQYLDLEQKAFPLTHLSTTTMGLSLPVTTISPFQIMRAEDTIMAKFKTW